MKIRKNDLVAVIAGNDADLTKSRRVLSTMPSKDKIVVEGVNRVYKHVRPNRRNMQGGRLSKEMPIQASNVLLFFVLPAAVVFALVSSWIRTERSFFLARSVPAISG